MYDNEIFELISNTSKLKLVDFSTDTPSLVDYKSTIGLSSVVDNRYVLEIIYNIDSDISLEINDNSGIHICHILMMPNKMVFSSRYFQISYDIGIDSIKDMNLESFILSCGRFDIIKQWLPGIVLEHLPLINKELINIIKTSCHE